MTLTLRTDDVDHKIQALRRDIFIDHTDAQRTARRIESSLREFLAAKELGYPSDARGVVILGRSGTGKTKSVLHALETLGLKRTAVGHSPRGHVFVPLRDDVTLRKLRMLISLEYGWTPKSRDSAEDIWQYVADYIERLETLVCRGPPQGAWRSRPRGCHYRP